ncbi:MAG: hypothetical protein KJ893_02025 [Candidatus Omnitrophica bacterium]|nr:hypothetical protein [Candidatus Omnitrophota bacterium]MBU4478637.1 hypothetical protein [Candidatus Omnitrophota bacterium]
MDKTKIQDPGIFYILGKLERYGHEKLPLAIIKEKQSYVIGHKRKRFSKSMGDTFLLKKSMVRP